MILLEVVLFYVRSVILSLSCFYLCFSFLQVPFQEHLNGFKSHLSFKTKILPLGF